MDCNITIFRGNKILFSIFSIFFILWTLTMKLNFNRFFFYFTEMRISTHIKSLLRFKLVMLVTCCSIEFFFYLTLIFLLLFLFYSTLPPPLAFAHLQQTPLHPNVTCSDRGWVQVGWVQVGGLGKVGGGGVVSVGGGGVGFSWGGFGWRGGEVAGGDGSMCPCGGRGLWVQVGGRFAKFSYLDKC